MKISDVRRANLLSLLGTWGSIAQAEREHPNLSAGYLRQLTGGHRDIGNRTARKLESEFGKPEGWMDVNRQEGAQTEDVAPSDSDDLGFIAVKRVKLRLSAGVSGFTIDYVDDTAQPNFFRAEWFAARRLDPDKLLGLKVSGSSMEPGLYDGDSVVINTLDTTPADGEVFAINYEGELVIKRMKRDGGEWWLASDNDDKRRYPDKRVGEGVILLGRVVYKSSERI